MTWEETGEHLDNKKNGRPSTKLGVVTFHVYRTDCFGVETFWMNARGKSERQLQQAIWWRNGGKIPLDRIRVVRAE